MAFLDAWFKRSPPALSTWVVTRSKENWEAIGMNSSVEVPPDPSLDGLVQAIEAQEKMRYFNAPNQSTAELQYAIYPWEQSSGITYIFKITHASDGYTATDVQGSNLSVSGISLDALVAKVGAAVADPTTAMLQLVKLTSQLV